MHYIPICAAHFGQPINKEMLEHFPSAVVLPDGTNISGGHAIYLREDDHKRFTEMTEKALKMEKMLKEHEINVSDFLQKLSV